MSSPSKGVTVAYLRYPAGFVRCTMREPVTLKPTTQPPGISLVAVDIFP